MRSRALDIARRSYAKLAAFESPGGGFEWFGGSPAHEALTAYGLMQFAEMSEAVPGLVDSAMVRRAL